MINDEHDGYSEHVTGLDIDKPGLWPWVRATIDRFRATVSEPEGFWTG